MSELKWTHGPITYKLTYDAILKDLIDDAVRMFRSIDALNLAIPLKEFKITKTVDHEYKITAWDNRLWKQTLKIPVDGNEPSMNFEVIDFWKLREFTPHREVRDNYIHCAQVHGVTSLKVTWDAPVYS